ncbi:hypothetical protein TPL01_23020 [Sulfuriferula plumbiphila]|uniref:DUF3617 domain-containing protein n=1 Tax=Sulfuriferula plumbiphila TaxID=171865 RepID=A0A512L9K1_9PROT|nr:DUF3617 domain-containing protein [Sulfuriferula plumbiphila]BBP06011.1 hypothetical protein SFPGR_34330 [Sulfuriferula plumbiphila]GEP31164.1 hypothetical protein TPL01_23020 [Sulfuriferula plumbiphila]
MRKTLLALVFVSSLPVSTACSAENDMRPGLWEITTTSDLLRLVSQIPPDQMQSLMNLAKQHGVDMPQIQNGAAMSSVCVTQKMADQKIPPGFYQNKSGCIAQNATHAGNTYTWDFVCANPKLKGNGTAQAVFANPENFTGRTEFDGVAQGAPVKEHADISGRWMSASCGAVKPPQ